MKRTLLFLALCVVLALTLVQAQQPSPPTNVTFVSNSSGVSAIDAILNTSGGSINEYNFDTIVQNPRWKAYVGNISGTLTLDDSSGSSLFKWNFTDINGQIYATRNESELSWSTIGCADSAQIVSEQTTLNHNVTAGDSINNTFDQKLHPRFFTSTTEIIADSCRSVNLYVNSTSQSEFFYQVLLNDGAHTIYSSLIEKDKPGFNNNTYDYQLLLPENADPTITSNTAYYFYVELS